jgi:hypothetical protein
MDIYFCPFFFIHPKNFQKKLRFSVLKHNALKMEKIVKILTACFFYIIFKKGFRHFLCHSNIVTFE